MQHLRLVSQLLVLICCVLLLLLLLIDDGLLLFEGLSHLRADGRGERLLWRCAAVSVHPVGDGSLLGVSRRRRRRQWCRDARNGRNRGSSSSVLVLLCVRQCVRRCVRRLFTSSLSFLRLSFRVRASGIRQRWEGPPT